MLTSGQVNSLHSSYIVLFHAFLRERLKERGIRTLDTYTSAAIDFVRSYDVISHYGKDVLKSDVYVLNFRTLDDKAGFFLGSYQHFNPDIDEEFMATTSEMSATIEAEEYLGERSNGFSLKLTKVDDYVYSQSYLQLLNDYEEKLQSNPLYQRIKEFKTKHIQVR